MLKTNYQRKSKTVSFRLKNDVYKSIIKLAGGKKRVNSFLKRKAEDLV
jgi:hypothetical protein